MIPKCRWKVGQSHDERWMAAGLGVLICALIMLTVHPWVQARETNGEVAELKGLSQAFTKVAKRVLLLVQDRSGSRYIALRLG